MNAAAAAGASGKGDREGSAQCQRDILKDHDQQSDGRTRSR